MAPSLWQQLSECLSDEVKQELSCDLLDALETDRWAKIEIIIVDHHVDCINYGKGKRFRHSHQKAVEIVNSPDL